MPSCSLASSVCVCVFLRALKMLIPVTSMAEVSESGISPLHSAAAGGHSQCIKVCVMSYSLNIHNRPVLKSKRYLMSMEVTLVAVVVVRTVYIKKESCFLKKKKRVCA